MGFECVSHKSSVAHLHEYFYIELIDYKLTFYEMLCYERVIESVIDIVFK